MVWKKCYLSGPFTEHFHSLVLYICIYSVSLWFSVYSLVCLHLLFILCSKTRTTCHIVTLMFCLMKSTDLNVFAPTYTVGVLLYESVKAASVCLPFHVAVLYCCETGSCVRNIVRNIVVLNRIELRFQIDITGSSDWFITCGFCTLLHTYSPSAVCG